VIVPSVPVTPCPAAAGPVTGGQICAQAPVHFDAAAVSGANEYRVNPWGLVTTLTPLIVAVFSAGGVPLPAPVPDDELEHAAAPITTAATPAAAAILIRMDLSFAPFSLPAVK
jgi:hypothetical protein